MVRDLGRDMDSSDQLGVPMIKQRWSAFCGDPQMNGWGIVRADKTVVLLYARDKANAEAIASEHNDTIDEIERLRAQVQRVRDSIALLSDHKAASIIYSALAEVGSPVEPTEKS